MINFFNIWIARARWLSVAFLYLGCSAKSSNANTIVNPKFTVAKFEAIMNGVRETDVTKDLGDPYETLTSLEFLAGGTNNYSGRLTKDNAPPNSVVIGYILRFSKPADPREPFEVFSVFTDGDGLVTGKDRYYAD